MNYRASRHLPRAYRPRYFTDFTKAIATGAAFVFVLSFVLTAVTTP